MQVYVHVGPPKTGTSSIQAWLVKNREVLQKFSVYYPEHPLDENGISSGNLASLFDIKHSGSLVFSEEKLNRLESICKSNNSKVLLLSSEFFFQEIKQIINHIPNVKLIYYLRFELETLDSSYNQTVKRHNNTDVFVAPEKGLSSNLRILWQLIAAYPEQFIVRYFAPDLFYGGQLIKDFLHCLNITNLDVQNSKTINSSYSPIAIEFKRKVNVLEDQTLLHKIDLLLQKNHPAPLPYTFMSEKEYALLKQDYIYQLKTFFMRFPIRDFDLFIDHCRKSCTRNSVSQSIKGDTFNKLLHEILGNKEINALLSNAIAKKRKALSKIFTQEELDILFSRVKGGRKVRLISKVRSFFRS